MNKFSIFNFQFSILFLAVFLSGLFFPLFSLAQGLVPCGGDGQPACDICHIFLLLQNVIEFVFKYFITPLAVLLLIIGGIMFFLYAENPKRVEQAKALIYSVIIGLILIFSSWLIINTFFMIIGVADWAEGWFQIECETAPSLDICKAPPTTNWGEGGTGCSGQNQRCYQGICRTCTGFMYDDGCGGCAGQGGRACWRLGARHFSCNNRCNAFGGCVAANWNDSTTCAVCREWIEGDPGCFPQATANAPIDCCGLIEKVCRTRAAEVYQHCGSWALFDRRYCVCQY